MYGKGDGGYSLLSSFGASRPVHHPSCKKGADELPDYISGSCGQAADLSEDRESSGMTNIDFSRYKRIVQYFWDPEPKNDDASKAPIWCLGLQYAAIADYSPAPLHSAAEVGIYPGSGFPTSTPTSQTPRSSRSSPVDDNLAGQGLVGGGDILSAWPSAFLDDFESKIWLTYRSNFPPIARSQGAESSAASFSARLKGQLVDHTGFTTDTGWGCMIRSGQSLLANALLILNLGRGR